MSNRSYLYLRDREEGRMGGLSEWNYEIPLSHLILVSADARLVRSSIWDEERPIAIQGDFREGRRRLLGFLNRLVAEGILAADELEETAGFLCQWNDRPLEAVLEAGEIFCMDDEEEIAEACRKLYEEVILSIEEYVRGQIEELRQLKADNREDEILERLGLEWSTILYYDLGSLDDAPLQPSPPPEGGMPDGKERIALRIARLRDGLKKSPSGHLPMGERIDLLYHLGDYRTVQKVMCECCKKVYSFWLEHVSLSPELTRLLSDINEWVYRGTGNAEALEQRASDLQNYVWHLMSGRQRTTAGYAVVLLGYCLTEEAAYVLRQAEEEYDRNDDDCDIDPESWLPDFAAECACTDSGDCEDAATAPLRRDFWEWYLDTVQTLYECPDREVVPAPVPAVLPETIAIPRRTQPEVKSNILFAELLKIQKLVLASVAGERQWTSIEVNLIELSGMYLQVFLYSGDEAVDVNVEVAVTMEICRIAQGIRKTMYRFAPEEGAWIQMVVHLTPLDAPQATYNYDSVEALGRYPYTLENLVTAFEKYPRSRLFTPVKWQALLPHDTKYLIADREKAVLLHIDLTDGRLQVNGTELEMPVSPGALVRAFGEEKTARGHRVATDSEGRTDSYAFRSCLVWNAAGIVATRDTDDSGRVATICLQMKSRMEQETTLPAPVETFCGQLTFGGNPFCYRPGEHFRSGQFEVWVAAEGKGYVEISCIPTRDQRDSWHNYTERTEVCFRKALDGQDCIRALERAEQRGRMYREGIPNRELLPMVSASYFAHISEAVRSGYASGQRESYVGSLLLPLMADAVSRQCDYGSLAATDLLWVFSACVLFGYDKGDLRKLAERLRSKGFQDGLVDRLVRYKLEDYPVADATVFPQLRQWLAAGKENGNDDLPEDLLSVLPEENRTIVAAALQKIRG